MNYASTLPGLHHMTAIAGDPQRNLDFYTQTLGLRLVKKTVNFDDPGTYHLYYGDGLGRPGTILTFFPWPGAVRGRQGTGQVAATALSVPAGALVFWQERLTERGVAISNSSTRFGDPVLAFEDPDGLLLELVAGADPDPRPGWPNGQIPTDAAIRGMQSVTLALQRFEPTETLLTGILGFRFVGEENGPEGNRRRYVAGDGGPGGLVDLVTSPNAPHGGMGAGVVHHIAWRTPDDATQQTWKKTLAERGIGVSPVMDRQYFHSIYFREPGGVLFEIATDAPGFAVDEEENALGATLKLPPAYEAQRAALERLLPPLTVKLETNA